MNQYPDPYKINPPATTYGPTWMHLLTFEIKSRLGRLLWRRPPPLTTTGPNLLNLGCGDRFVEGWINADFFCGFRFWRSNQRPDWMWDFRFPLPCPDAVFDGIFSEHVIEHLYPHHVLALLNELRRVLKPHSWLRITVPDLSKYVAFYISRNAHFGEWTSGCEAIRALTQDWGHVSVWDISLLRRYLTAAGFTKIVERSFQEGDNPRLLLDDPKRVEETMYCEALKPD
ncbi:Methyltransferase domain-containing protein [Desulfovibrionales bacterium]